MRDLHNHLLVVYSFFPIYKELSSVTILVCCAQVGMSGGAAEDGEVLEETRPTSHHYEWLLVAAAVDRIAVLAFIATFFITFIAYVAAV